MKKLTLTFAAITVALLALGVALEANAADYWVGRATGPTAVFCFPKNKGVPASVIPSEGTYIAPCRPLLDAGTISESDGGQPCAASTTDNVYRPTTTGPAAIPLGLSVEEGCVAIKVQSGDAGTVDFYRRTVP